MIQVARVEPTPETLAVFAGISTEFVVTARAEPKALDNGAVVALAVATSYVKANDEDPRDWLQRYDLARWALFVASDDGAPVGACAVARETPSLYFASGPDDALLWDVRVAPEARGRGVGKALLDAAIAWARDAGCVTLLIETQDTNVAACRLYASAGCTVASIQPGAYVEYPDELLVVWRLALGQG